MTDGEVDDSERVLELISNHSNENRCFAIGIGRGCDAGLVEGIANASGGICDFVQEEDLISEKVIPQLLASLHPSVTSLEIHIEGEDNDSFEVSPYPLPSVNANGSTVVYIRQKKRENAFNGGILITGSYGKASIEIPIEDVQRLANVEEDKFGSCGGKNIGKAIIPLFAFSILKKLERKEDISDEDKMKAIELSISSGVLCKYTGYVGMTEQPTIEHRYSAGPSMMSFCQAMGCCYCSAPPQQLFSCCNAASMNCYADTQVFRNYAPQEPISHFQAPQQPISYFQAPQQQIKVRPNPLTDDDHKWYPTKYDLIPLARYQKAGGFWENLEAVKSITGIEIDQIDEVNLPDKGTELRCVATILAIAAMRVESSNEKNSWAMIEMKALKWLKNTLPNIDIEQVISKIQHFVP